MTYGSVAKSTIANRGVFGFYRGLSSMVYFAAPKASIRFGAFEFCSGLLTNKDGGDKYGLGPVSCPTLPLRWWMITYDAGLWLPTVVSMEYVSCTWFQDHQTKEGSVKTNLLFDS